MSANDLVAIEFVSRSTERVQTLVLRTTGEFQFQAGQYLQIAHPSGALIPLTIATGPDRLPELHLHYRSSDDAPEAALLDELLAASEPGSFLNICGPYGGVVLQDFCQQPLLFIAAGTGVAQAASFIDEMTATPPTHPVTLLFCAATQGELYLRRWLAELDAPWLDAVLIADARRTPDNEVFVWLRAHATGLADHRIVLAGSPGFVYAAVDVLVELGIDESILESDVFSYAPRA